MKQIGYIILLASVCLSSCSYMRNNHRDDNVVAEIGEQKLYHSDIEALTQNAQSPEDSASIAEAYIRQWAEDILFYEKARKSANPDMEQLVEDYRRSLYLHEYEQQYVTAKMPKELNEDSVRLFYDANPKQFVLKENILKGVFLIVPNDAPDKGKLENWLKKPMTNIEQIEKYAYQYAIGYQLFTDNWCTDNQILLRMPFERNELNGQIIKGNLIQKSDSSNTYLLQITDKHLAGDVMPFSYAEPEIRRLMLSRRQVDFIRQHKAQLYEKALNSHHLTISE